MSRRSTSLRMSLCPSPRTSVWTPLRTSVWALPALGVAVALALAVTAARPAAAAPPPPAAKAAQAAQARHRVHTCPLCGGHARAIGHDGRASPRRYSDLEVPTRAYTNLVMACPKCGYAAWSQDFTATPPAAAAYYTRRYLKKTAKRAAVDPVLAYQHHMNLLHARRAGLPEQIGGALFYTYVLKRGRPYGGMDPKLERRILKARKRALALLKLAMKRSPPDARRARLEWQYLIGELQRLTGDPKAATKPLQEVCWARKEAGYTVGRLACQMLERAKRGETWEDYRDGVTDAREIPAAERKAKAIAAEAKRDAAARKKAEEEARKKAEAEAKAAATKKAPPAQAPVAPAAPPPGTKDPYAPAPPPVAK